METLNLAQKRGETWQGLSLNYKIDGVNVDLTNAFVLMQIKKNACDNDAVYEFSTDNGRVTITEPLSGTFVIAATIFDLAPKVYYYDLMVELPDANRTDYLIGGSFEILSNVSRKTV